MGLCWRYFLGLPEEGPSKLRPEGVHQGVVLWAEKITGIKDVGIKDKNGLPVEKEQRNTGALVGRVGVVGNEAGEEAMQGPALLPGVCCRKAMKGAKQEVTRANTHIL